MAVAVTIDGKRYFVEYGLASKQPANPVTRDTLFELGSISKTFTATLATLAETEGKLSLNDSVSKHLPELKGSPLGRVRLLELGTHTAGGFPLQVPDEIKTREQLMAYFRAWKPESPAGTRRNYANPSIGLLGVIAARALGATFETLVEERLFREMGLARTHLKVPATALSSYAWGYNREDKPIRVAPGLLDAEAYGVKSTAADMIRYVEASMGVGQVPAKVARALNATHTGYYRAGEMTQALIWERYPYPVDIEKMVSSNSAAMIFEGSPVTPIVPPAALASPHRALDVALGVILSKTGSTNGFGAYVAFVPSKRIGIVMLANKSYPNEARLRAAHQVLTLLTTE